MERKQTVSRSLVWIGLKNLAKWNTLYA